MNFNNAIDRMGATILLVEDDPRDTELTLLALAEFKLANRVTTVSNGLDAMDYLLCRGAFHARVSGNPLVVLLDNKIPKMTGLEVLKLMKADERLRRIPVVALTSSRQAPDLVAFYKLGVNACVVKPVDFSEFMKAIQQVGIFWLALNIPPPGPATTACKVGNRQSEIPSTLSSV